MNLRSLFNITVPVSAVPPPHQQKFGPQIIAGDIAEVAQAKNAGVGAFVTPQTLVTFPGATGVITAIWAAIRSFGPVSKPYDLLIGAGLSGLVGVVIYFMSDTLPDRKSRIVAAVIALINTILLFNASRAVMGFGSL